MDPYLGFDEFVVARTAALSRVAFLLTGDHHLAQDLLQVALSRLTSRWPEVRHGMPDGPGDRSARTHRRQAVGRLSWGAGAPP